MMKVKKKGFVMAVAYFFKDKCPTEPVNICTLFWRFTIQLIPALIVLSVMFVLVIPTATVLGFFVARRFNWKMREVPGESEPPTLIFYDHWLRLKGHRIYPVTPLIAVAGLYGLYRSYLYRDVVLEFVIQYKIPLVVVGLLAFLFFILGLRKFFKTETGRLVHAWLQAKKEKLCPIVEVVD